METLPGYNELAEKAGISRSYANEIIKGRRNPRRPLAIHIFRATGWKPKSIAELSDEQIDMLEQVEPWRTPAAA